MAANGLIGAKRRGRAWKTTVVDPEGCERPDLVNRDFKCSAIAAARCGARGTAADTPPEDS